MSDNNGLENTKYKLIKNEDKLILTDKKTLKSRVLEVEDIDYVVDDNQRLRDPNVIENYFRLKDEPYEPKMMTKTADYVREQKEADLIYSTNKYEDLIDEFIKKYSFTINEIKKLALIPDESTIKNLPFRTMEDKKAIINDFKILKKKLTENKNLGVDIFTYLKTYFDNYQYNLNLLSLYEKVDIKDYLKDKVFYSDNDDYKKVKNLDNLKSLKDLSDNHIDNFGNINFTLLSNLISKFKKIQEIYKSNKDKCKLAQPIATAEYNLNLTSNAGSGIGGGDLSIKELVKLYQNLNDDEKQFFNETLKDKNFKKYNSSIIPIMDKLNKKGLKASDNLKKLVDNLKIEDFSDFIDYMNTPIDKIPDEEKIEFKRNKPKETKGESSEEEQDEEIAPIEEKKDETIEGLKIDKTKFEPVEIPKPIEPPKPIPEPTAPLKKYIEANTIKNSVTGDYKVYLSIYNPIFSLLLKKCDQFEEKPEKKIDMDELITKITTEGLGYFNTTVKIQLIIDLINNSKTIGSSYVLTSRFWCASKTNQISYINKDSRKVYSGFEKNISQDWLRNGVSVSEPFKPFLSVCEKINDIVKKSIKAAAGYKKCVSAGWTDDTLVRIEKINDILREYSSGRINTSLLNVMRKTKLSSGWTDDTLVRIEKISNVLKDY